MTVCELIYIIGCGVAFLMCMVGISKYANGVIDSCECVILSLLGACLSWAVPIWYIGLVYFENKKCGIRIKGSNNSIVLIKEKQDD